MKKIIIFSLICLYTSIASAASENIDREDGYGKSNGWVTANMSMIDGKLSMDAAYSINMFHDFGLVPVAYCASGGSHLGEHYIFFVNPYHDCLIIGRIGGSVYGNVFEHQGPAFEHTGKIIYYSDVWPHQNLYRAAIRVAKAAYAEYQANNKIE